MRGIKKLVRGLRYRELCKHSEVTPCLGGLLWKRTVSGNGARAELKMTLLRCSFLRVAVPLGYRILNRKTRLVMVAVRA